jgi:hypothetical protein
MTLTCHRCAHPFDGRRYARRTDDGWAHVRCPRPCRDCGRHLVDPRTWNALDKRVRGRVKHERASDNGDGVCKPCAQKPDRSWTDEQLAYDGGWERRGLILRPTGRAA